LFRDNAEELGITIKSLKIMPDHVHLFVKPSPVLAPHVVIGQFKGHASRILCQECPSLVHRLPSLWRRCYDVESVDPMSEDVIGKTIEEQRGK
jgi:putative transposase